MPSHITFLHLLHHVTLFSIWPKYTEFPLLSRVDHDFSRAARGNSEQNIWPNIERTREKYQPIPVLPHPIDWYSLFLLS